MYYFRSISGICLNSVVCVCFNVSHDDDVRRWCVCVVLYHVCLIVVFTLLPTEDVIYICVCTNECGGGDGVRCADGCGILAVELVC